MKKIFSKKIAAIAITGAIMLALVSLTNTGSYENQLGQATLVKINVPVTSGASITAKTQVWTHFKQAGKALWEAGEWVVYYTQFAPPKAPSSKSTIALNNEIAAKQKEIKMASLN